MDSSDLKRYLAGTETDILTLDWLKTEFMPIVVERLNSDDSRKRLGLYGGDQIPVNERNLTDFRNRISLIFEYEFARVITSILQEHNIDDLFCAYVVANRFPDLEMRRSDGRRGLRFEVKCLQSTAEEKAANFSTLRKDLQPSTDFLTVFLWDWKNETSDVKWDRAPFVFDSFVFNASPLSTLRDWYWLNKPPSNLGDGYQGFDIRYAVNCVNGNYNEEEGNLGKLLRIWQRDIEHRPPSTPILDQTEEDYLQFKNEVVICGFEVLAKQILPILSGVPYITDAIYGYSVVGKMSGNYGFIASSKLNSRKDIQPIMNELSLTDAWVLQDKYQWRRYTLDADKFKEASNGRKPKLILTDHREG